MTKLSYLIRTYALNSDERFQKTCDFVRRAGASVEVFAVVKYPVPDQKQSRQVTLWLRRWFPSGRFVALKYLELMIRTAAYMSMRPRRRWFANFDFLPFHLVSAVLSPPTRKPVWDLHEMPPAFVERSELLRRILAFLLGRSAVILCNDARRIAMEDVYDVDLAGALILRNLPARAAHEALVARREAHLAGPLGASDARRIVIVGGGVPGRYVRESIETIATLRRNGHDDLQVLIVGGAAWDGPEDFVQSTGFIPFDQLIACCVSGGISLCFYAMNTPNNRFCDPNRFFQALAAGQHVLTFDHPSLRDLGYPWHHVIDEGSFSDSLFDCLRSILAADDDPQERLAWSRRETGAALVFESQFPRFAAWFGAG